MNSKVLVDTSSWTQALRRSGDAAIRARVTALLTESRAVWCDPVRLESWNGAKGEQERRKLRSMEAALPSLPIGKDVWDLACNTASKARASGLNVPAIDLVVFACAKVHGVALEHADRHYELLEQLGN